MILTIGLQDQDEFAKVQLRFANRTYHDVNSSYNNSLTQYSKTSIVNIYHVSTYD